MAKWNAIVLLRGESGTRTLSVDVRGIAALEQAGWVEAKAARLLGMTPRQIAYRIQTMKIRVKQFRRALNTARLF